MTWLWFFFFVGCGPECGPEGEACADGQMCILRDDYECVEVCRDDEDCPWPQECVTGPSCPVCQDVVSYCD